jgi:hypothetical protein
MKDIPSSIDEFKKAFRIIVGSTCGKCDGSGVALYFHIHGWREALEVKPASITYEYLVSPERLKLKKATFDICDCCWGSGDLNRPWVNLLDLWGKGVISLKNIPSPIPGRPFMDKE